MKATPPGDAVLAALPQVPAPSLETIGTPTLWAVTITAVVGLLALDFVITRRPHAVSMRETVGWSVFYVALPLAFGAYIWLSSARCKASST